MYKTIQISEGSINLVIPNPKQYRLDSKMPVFYNPVMKLNRDINVAFLKAYFGNKTFSALDVMAASGVRGLRIAKEFPKAKVYLNDKNPQAVDLIKQNKKLNKIKNAQVSKENANVFCLKNKGKFDYVDVDPFGTPVDFLDSAVRTLTKNGIIAVTATDTSALCGTYPKACARKYSSVPLRNFLMHEIGLRILIKKIQDTAAQYDIALTPLFAHSSNHYMRVYLKAELGAKKTDSIVNQIKDLFYNDKEFSIGKKGIKFGKVWTGKLWDSKIVKEMIKHFDNELLRQIYEESKISTIGYFDLHYIAKKLKKATIPKSQIIIDNLKKKGFKASRTHFLYSSIRTNASYKEIKKLVK
jgi:tRNA (guanine26-N2/guanine27-N2)-dimethyltransferase